MKKALLLIIVSLCTVSCDFINTEVSRVMVASGTSDEFALKSVCGVIKLEYVELPFGLKSIGKSAFAGCQSLKEVYCKPKTPPTLGTNAFSRNATERKIYIHAGLIDTYKQAAVWSDYADSFTPADFY